MGAVYEGKLDGAGLRVGIVVSRFNSLITERLLEGALDRLRRSNVADETIDVCRVPGAFEVPRAAKVMAETGRYDGIVALAAVIRGATPHFEYVASQAARGIAQIALASGVPTIFGVLTADTIEQAVERAGTKAGNRGFDAAAAAIEMINLLQQL